MSYISRCPDSLSPDDGSSRAPQHGEVGGADEVSADRQLTCGGRGRGANAAAASESWEAELTKQTWRGADWPTALERQAGTAQGGRECSPTTTAEAAPPQRRRHRDARAPRLPPSDRLGGTRCR